MLFCFRRLGLPILRAIPARTATTARLVRCALALGLRLRRLLLLGLALRLRFSLGVLLAHLVLAALAERLLSASSSAAARRAGLLGGLLRARGLGFAGRGRVDLVAVEDQLRQRLKFVFFRGLAARARLRGDRRQILRDRRIVFSAPCRCG